MTRYSRLQLEKIFKAVDDNGDGFIDPLELKELMQENGVTVNSEQIAKIIQMVDANGDGLIDLSEFIQLIAASDRSHHE